MVGIEEAIREVSNGVPLELEEMVASPCRLFLAPSLPLEGACRLPLTALPVKGHWLTTLVLVRYNT